jgi:hypothetical protein
VTATSCQVRQVNVSARSFAHVPTLESLERPYWRHITVPDVVPS